MDIWPKLDSPEKAEESVYWAAGICYFVSALTTIAAVIAILSGHSVLGVDGWALFDAGIFAFFGWRIWKKRSRVIAVVALGFYILECIYRYSVSTHPPTPILMIIFVWGLIQGIRGTFAYKKLATPVDLDIVAETEMQAPGAFARNWKKWITIGISGSIGLCICLLMIGGIYNKYENRPSEVKTWPNLQINASTLNVTLKSQYDSGLHYVFTASPSSSDYLDSFNSSTSNMRDKSFTILFKDKNGFQICSIDVDPPTRMSGDDGKIISLESNGQTSLCSADDYRKAETWGVTWSFPELVKQPTY